MVTSRALRRLLDVWDGGIVSPANLEREIARNAVARTDTMIEHMRAATLADLGDVPALLRGLSSLSAKEMAQLARRLGWTVNALVNCDPQQDVSGAGIEAALASSTAWDDAGTFWEALGPRLDGRRVTMAALEVVLRLRVPQADGLANAPVWERENWQALQEAERTCDWTQLGKRSQTFDQLPQPDPCASQATVALALLDWPRFVRIADTCRTWLHGHFFLSPLPLAHALRIATASTSSHLRFAALERVVMREVRTLSPEEETSLRNMLIVLSKDSGWSAWLNLCNHYPSRHPHIQAALGRALARIDQSALEAYVASISLSASINQSRECVTHCLSVFRARAGAARRLALWHRAFERWQAWHFGADGDKGLSAVAWSELDYAVVGWLIEGAHKQTLNELDQAFVADLHTLDLQWHPSLNAATGAFLRLVSRFQIYAHACNRSTDDQDWLPGPGVYMPAAAADEFVRRRFRFDVP